MSATMDLEESTESFEEVASKALAAAAQAKQPAKFAPSKSSPLANIAWTVPPSSAPEVDAEDTAAAISRILDGIDAGVSAPTQSRPEYTTMPPAHDPSPDMWQEAERHIRNASESLRRNVGSSDELRILEIVENIEVLVEELSTNLADQARAINELSIAVMNMVHLQSEMVKIHLPSAPTMGAAPEEPPASPELEEPPALELAVADLPPIGPPLFLDAAGPSEVEPAPSVADASGEAAEQPSDGADAQL